MPNEAIVITARSLIEGLEEVVDGYSTHSHKFTTQTGNEPLIRGRPVTDYANPQPAEITLIGHVSNFPGGTRQAEAYAEIHRVWSTVEIVRVVTEWAVWPEMIVVSVQIDPAGRGMRFDIKLRHLIQVTPPRARPATASEQVAADLAAFQEDRAADQAARAGLIAAYTTTDEDDRIGGVNPFAPNPTAPRTVEQQFSAHLARVTAAHAKLDRGQAQTVAIPPGRLPSVPNDPAGASTNARRARAAGG